MRERWRVAVLDSGLGSGLAQLLDRAVASSFAAAPSPAVAAPGPAAARELAWLPEPVSSCRFVDDGRTVVCSAVVPDPLGHGTSVAKVICDSSNRCDLLVGQVLDHRGVTTAAALAAAIDWSVRAGANLIHMSLGLREDRQVLAEAVAATLAAGCIIVASTPARGEGTYPARYPGVIRATGDARCQWDEISDLHSKQADFGGCPRHASAAAAPDGLPTGAIQSGAHAVHLNGACHGAEYAARLRAACLTHVGAASATREGVAHVARPGGASLGAAHVTQFLVEHVAPGSHAVAVRAQLRTMARYTGVEARGVPVAANANVSREI